MKAVYLEKPWQITLADIEQRPLRPEEALVKIRSAGICGSDIAAFRGTNSLVSYPRVIGHELAGEILSIPSKNRNGLKMGDRVIVDPYLYCGHCYPCSLGRTNCCTSLKVLGVHVNGGMTETFAHPADLLVKVPDEIPWALIPLAEPLTIALHGLHRLKLKSNEHIAIFGSGPIGLLAAMVALHYGAHPIMIDLVEERLRLASQLGIQHTVNVNTDILLERISEITNGRMVECVMEASGANSAIRNTLDVVSHAGRIALTGWPKQDTAFPTDIITKKELDIRGARTSAGEFEEALKLIATGAVNTKRILTKTVMVDEAPEIIRDIEKNPGNYLKVNVMFN